MKSPSCLATKRLIATASASLTFTAPVSIPGRSSKTLKFSVMRLIPTPSVTVSNGFFKRFPSASSFVYMTPRETRLNNPLPCGSARKSLTDGFRSFSATPTPASVPPVPHAHTKASSSAPISENISTPVPSACARKFAKFSNWSAKYPPPTPSRARARSASRLATLTKCPRFAIDTGRTRSTRAPYASTSADFSFAASSGMATKHSTPIALHTMASDTPVLPAVPSVHNPPRRSAPLAKASSTIRRATRSFTEPPGLRNSHLT